MLINDESTLIGRKVKRKNKKMYDYVRHYFCNQSIVLGRQLQTAKADKMERLITGRQKRQPKTFHTKDNVKKKTGITVYSMP